MGTRSYIALQIEEDEYLTIFCHYNGYPDDNGAILAEHYDKQEKVESLIQLGDLYFLRSKLEPNPDLPHNHSTPQPNVTIAYNRDEGWSDCEAVHEALKPSCTGATLLEGKVWKSTAKKEELSVWADSLACR